LSFDEFSKTVLINQRINELRHNRTVSTTGRRLFQFDARRSLKQRATPSKVNWITSENPAGRPVVSPVRDQDACGESNLFRNQSEPCRWGAPDHWS
jgi:hypothetical protein